MAFSDSEILALERIMRTANTSSLRDVVHDAEIMERFWDSAADAFGRAAKNRTGGVVLGALGGLLNKIWLFVILAGVVYAVGGASALPKLWAFLTADKP